MFPTEAVATNDYFLLSDRLSHSNPFYAIPLNMLAINITSATPPPPLFPASVILQNHNQMQ